MTVTLRGAGLAESQVVAVARHGENVALAAAGTAGSGADLDTVEAVARSAQSRGHVFLVVHRLDNLRRSGRIGTATSWLGTALALKPLLCLDVDGRLVLDQRIRTVTKAHAALVERVAEVTRKRGPLVIETYALDVLEGPKGEVFDRSPPPELE